MPEPDKTSESEEEVFEVKKKRRGKKARIKNLPAAEEDTCLSNERELDQIDRLEKLVT